MTIKTLAASGVIGVYRAGIGIRLGFNLHQYRVWELWQSKHCTL
ncbi:MAG TPA: hypothetical protein VGJ93_08270 [Desulfuromonadaceae bacterium]